MADKSIRATSAAVDSISSDWAMIDALMEGTVAMRAGGKTWLPQFPKEPEDSYKTRLSQAVLHPVFKRTVLVNAARPFSKPIALGDETPAKVIDWCEDIDLQGSNLAAYLVPLMEACLAKGLIGVLVEFPKANDIRTQAEEKAVGARPYCVKYPAGSILGWKTATSPNGLQISQLRLLEQVDVEDGPYAMTSIEQVRVLTPGKWELWRQNPKDPDEWLLFDSGTTTLNFVPFVFYYGLRKAFGIGVSPLRDLAYQNVEHWQSASDQQTILHVARVPILFARMFGEGTLSIGAGAVASSENEKAELKYAEHSGAAIEAGKDSLIDLQDRMRSTGAELISLEAAYTTATQVSSDSEASKSLLQQLTENFEESAQEMLDYMAAWVSEGQNSEITLYKDFGVAANPDPGTLSGAVGSGTLSKQTHFEELQRRDVITPERTWDEEKLRLAAETSQDIANQAAAVKATTAAGAPSN